jgi:hypothetical protein
MHKPHDSANFHRLLDPLSDCLTPESARRLLKLKADPKLRARVEMLGRKSNRGTLTDQEREEYGYYVAYGTFISTLKAKARLLLAKTESPK